MVLKYVPESLKTAELCLEAVAYDGCELEYVPENLKTAEMCSQAVKTNGEALKFVPENLKTAELCRTAIRQYYTDQNRNQPPKMSKEHNTKKGTFTDPRDGKEYKTVKIGNQVWMAENLAYDAEGSKCYDNDESNGEKYGRLYNLETAKKACPAGWHLPSKEEWNILVDFAGGEEIAGEKLKAKSGWKDYEGKSGNGTDDFGFAALPAGYFLDGNFEGIGTLWWSSSNYEFYYNYSNSTHCGNYFKFVEPDIESDFDLWSDLCSKLLLSVRCVQDN